MVIAKEFVENKNKKDNDVANLRWTDKITVVNDDGEIWKPVTGYI